MAPGGLHAGHGVGAGYGGPRWLRISLSTAGSLIDAMIGLNFGWWKDEPGQVVLGSGEKPIIGVPTEAFFPPYVRSVIREFLKAQGFESPKTLAMTDPSFEQAACPILFLFNDL